MLHVNEFDENRPADSIRLSALFPSATRTGSGEVVVTSCSTDWREVKPGDVYVALPDCLSLDGNGADGNSADGHMHAQRAVSHGAIAVVGEQPVPVFDVPTYLVPDSRVALGEICQALVGQPTQSLQVIGVTGTHGKSTTIALLESIFATAGKTCGKLSSLGCYDGMTHSGGISDAPSAPTLALRLARMAASGCTHAFVEVSSQALSQVRLAGMELDGVCVTNVTAAHLDQHNTVQSYRETKRRIFDYLSATGVAVLNADDPVSMKWLERVTGPVLTYGFGAQAEIRATVIECQANEQTFVLTAGNESVAVRTAIIGEHHVANCLAAATLSLSYGIDLLTIAAGLEAVENLPARMERVDCGQGFPVFVDAANSAEALRMSLRTARRLAQRRVICVWSETNDGTSREQLAISHVLHRLADLVIVTDSFPTPVSDFQAEGCGQRPPSRAEVEVVADRGEAIACAVAIAEPGDVVVIAGSQVASGLAFGTPQQSISDGELAKQLLAAREEPSIRLVA